MNRTETPVVREFHLGPLLSSLAVALDFTYHGLAVHHHQVAHVALEIGRVLGLSGDALRELYCAALLHDVGAVRMREKAALAEFEVDDPFDHCARGRDFLADVPLFADLSSIVAGHHDRWQGGNPGGLAGAEIPLPSRIIHLADRLAVGLETGEGDILGQRDDLLARLRESAGTVFDPVLTEALGDVSGRESFWLDLESPALPALLQERWGDLLSISLNPGDLFDISRMFARVIDAKSAFTYRHSALVTRVAVRLARRLGFRGRQLCEMQVAGLLHDLGKLSVPEEILEKPGKLNRAEYNVIKRHTYYTYHLLRPISGFENIREWAAYHHERLDGRGYPFGIGAADLSLGARVVAVAALVEDRPYRAGMPRPEVARIVERQVGAGALDPDVAGVLLREMDEYLVLKDDPWNDDWSETHV